MTFTVNVLFTCIRDLKILDAAALKNAVTSERAWVENATKTNLKESYPTNVHCERRYDQSAFSGPPKIWDLSISSRNPFPSVNNRTKQARFLQK